MVWAIAALVIASTGYSVCVPRGRAVWAYQRPKRRFSLRKARIIGPVCYPTLRVAAGPGCRVAYHQISTDAYVCGSDVTVRRGFVRKGTILPRVPDGRLVPSLYWRIRGHVDLLDRPGGRITKSLHSGSIINGYVAGRWLRTGYGIIPRDRVERIRIPTFHGVHDPRLPIGWVYWWGRTRIRRQDGTPTGRRVPRYTVVRVLGRSGDLIRTDLGWIRSSRLRIARRRPRPDGVGPNERWISVSLEDWTLVAYEGDRPVFATMIGRGPNTPRGSFRIFVKYAMSEMGLGRKGRWRFRVFGVPWTMKIVDKISLHAAFWHDEFGYHISQGCINLSPRDARWLYHWTGPTVMPGFFEIRSSRNDSGTLVVIQ